MCTAKSGGGGGGNKSSNNGGRSGSGGKNSAAAKVAARRAKERADAATKSSNNGGRSGSGGKNSAAAKVAARRAKDIKTATNKVDAGLMKGVSDTKKKTAKTKIKTNIVKSAKSKTAKSAYEINRDKAWNDSLTVKKNADAVAANRSTKYNSASRDKFLNGGTATTKAATTGTRVVTKTKKKNTNADRNVISSKGNISADNKYNQKYWANQIKSKADGGAGRSQADVLAQQKKIGMAKAYSGDKVVTTANKDTAHFKLRKLTGSDATLQNGGVTKTVKKNGLFGEGTDTTYDYKDGTSVVTKAKDHGIFGGKKSTTFVGKTGDDSKVATNTITNTGSDDDSSLGKGTVTKLAAADAADDKVVAKNIVSVSGSTVTAGDKGADGAGGVNGAAGTNGAAGVTGTDGKDGKNGRDGKVVTTPAATLAAAAGNSVQPEALKNQLAIKKNKARQGKRKLRSVGATGANFGGKGTGLNIAV